MAELASQPTSIQTLYGWFTEGKLFVNRRYQRKLVWTLEEKQRLIESILKKYPIPAMLIAERESSPGTYEIIDGLQRLHAIVSFIETSFSTIDGEYFNVDYFPTAKNRADAGQFLINTSAARLTRKDVGILLDYVLALSVMRNATEDEINDVFGRINTYGHRLSDQERRQAGVQNEFSELVRKISCTIRGDASTDVLPLSLMPSISIDLPMTKHGYEVRADEVFWVQQGILRSTDLRDSMDEQCVADIAACIVGGSLIERSKEALDLIYSRDSSESARILAALQIYGADNFAQEFKFCVDEILKVCEATPTTKLRDILFVKTTNAFPSTFAVLLIAFHELIVKEGKSVSDYEGARKSLQGLANRIETTRRATLSDERKKNIDTIKGLISEKFVNKSSKGKIYSNHSTVDVDAIIRRSEIELPSYELKQGLLLLSDSRGVDEGLVEKVIFTIAAIANNGPQLDGRILLGVTDKKADADRIEKLDNVKARRVGKRYVVGVVREAKVLGFSMEKYLQFWVEKIRVSGLSEPLRSSVLSAIDFNSYYGHGVLVFSICPQTELSFVGNDVYWRDGDTTKRAEGAKEIASIAKRF